MPVSAINFETILLKAIWLGSLGLSLLSISVMVILILRRMNSERRKKYMLQRKQELMRYFYAALKSPVALTEKSLPVITKTDYPTVMRIALDMLRTLRGEEVQRIIRVLELWNLSPYLTRIVDSGRKGKRIQALTLLGYFADESSLAVLLKYVSHTDMYIQIAALRGLALRGATEHIPKILGSLTHSGQTNTLMLSDILQRFGTAAIPDLLALVQSKAKSEIRIAGIMALSSIGALQAVDVLMKLTNDPDSDVRAQAIAALGKIGDDRAADAMAAHLEEPEVSVRVQAAQALGGLQSLNTLPKLAACLADDQWWVRFRAAESIYQFGDKGIAALKAISAQDSNAGLIARQVLGEQDGIA